MDLFFASCPRGLELLLQEELRSFGASGLREMPGGVHFQGDLEVGYRACLWSRLASRVLRHILAAPIADGDELYQLGCQVDWLEHLSPSTSFAIDASVRHASFSDNRFAALRLKDALVDTFRDRGQPRPDVDRQRPDLKLSLHIDPKQATIAVDLAGEALHRRGYRRYGGEAPIRENLAAGLLMRAGWPKLADSGGGLVDPMCGSGTLVIEAALMAADIAPGLSAQRSMRGWRLHQPDLWQRLVDEAKARRDIGRQALQAHYLGYDSDGDMIRIAREHARRAGLAEALQFREVDIGEHKKSPMLPSQGLLICNPPYGERIGTAKELADLYRVLGETLIAEYGGWNAAILTGEIELAQQIRMRPRARYALFNGALACTLVDFGAIQARAVSPAAEMFINRLKKNTKHIRKYLSKNDITCYRVYDRDLPEYAAAIDVYRDHLHIQEYQAPPSVPEGKARARLSELVYCAGQTLDIPSSRVVVKHRQRQRGTEQYRRQANSEAFFWVTEGGLRLRVNLRDYLDTGLFLDHRETRAMLREMASGTRFLNLFAYTGSATVYAAAGGAIETTSVDLSRSYLEWARANLTANGFDGPAQHRLERADATAWLNQCQRSFDLIFLDPPTFSNSKRMQDIFDIQRDYGTVLKQCLRCLSPQGAIVFSTNARRFKFDTDALEGVEIRDFTQRTVPPDFSRQTPHRCWVVRHAPTE